jgi:hypothetical protein
MDQTIIIQRSILSLLILDFYLSLDLIIAAP